MSKLQKFVEKSSGSEKSGRVAYAFGQAALPPANSGMAWQKIETFKPADEVLNNENLKTVFKAAIQNGCAIVTER